MLESRQRQLHHHLIYGPDVCEIARTNFIRARHGRIFNIKNGQQRAVLLRIVQLKIVINELPSLSGSRVFPLLSISLITYVLPTMVGM